MTACRASRHRVGLSGWRRLAPVVLALLASPAALAQRADTNVVTEAEDAFGLSMNGQSLGLYNSRNIRNSDPVLLGNLRLDGLYFDRQGSFTSQLINISAIRVGIGTIDFPFPAPGGIVDFRLRDMPDEDELAVTLGLGRFASPYLDIDVARWLLEKRLSMTGGVSMNPRDGQATGGVNRFGSAALHLQFRPAPGLTLGAFANRIWDWRIQRAPVFYLRGALPPPPPRGVDIGQPWAKGRGSSSTAGLRADWVPGGHWSTRAGFFYSERALDQDFETLFVDIDATGQGRQLVSSSRGRLARSVSGESQLRYWWSLGRFTSAVDASLLGRYVLRRFGGAELLDLGTADIDGPAPVSVADPGGDGPLSRDLIQQWMAGLRYRAELEGWGLLSTGIQTSSYGKRFRSLEAGSTSSYQTSHDVLLHATVAAPIGHGIAVYASYAEGLQEGGVAPADAANRYQVLPMIKSRQLDGGVRYLHGRTLIDVAAFAEEKPYAASDGEAVYRLIGSVRNRGIEASVSSQPVSGLKLIAGWLLLVPDVGIDGDVAGGGRAIGVPTRRGQLNVDYLLPKLRGASADLRLDYSGGAATSMAQSVELPDEISVDLGFRVPFQIAQTRFVLRVQSTNVFDGFAWRVDGNAAFTYSPPRTFAVALTAAL